MARVKCGCCDQWIDENDHPYVLAFGRPEQYFDVPEHQRSRRIRDTDDVCVIDDRVFFIRGVLRVPITGLLLPFEWGPWAMIEEPDFHRYIELCRKSTGQAEDPPFVGWLSNVPFPYPHENARGFYLSAVWQNATAVQSAVRTASSRRGSAQGYFTGKGASNPGGFSDTTAKPLNELR